MPIGTTLTILPVFGLLCVFRSSDGGFADLEDCLMFSGFFSITLRFLPHNFGFEGETIPYKIRATNSVPNAIVPFIFPFRTPSSDTFCTKRFPFDTTNKVQLEPHTLLWLYLQLRLSRRRRLPPTSDFEFVLLRLHTHRSLF